MQNKLDGITVIIQDHTEQTIPLLHQNFKNTPDGANT